MIPRKIQLPDVLFCFVFRGRQINIYNFFWPLWIRTFCKDLSFNFYVYVFFRICEQVEGVLRYSCLGSAFLIWEAYKSIELGGHPTCHLLRGDERYQIRLLGQSEGFPARITCTH